VAGFLAAIALSGLPGVSPSPNAAAAAFLLAHWLYHALAECSGRQATPGKRVLGLRVVDGAGQRIGFGRASGRAWLGAAIVLVTGGLAAALLVWVVGVWEEARFRSTSSAAQERLRALSRAEEELLERTGAYLPFAAPADGVPGKSRRAWSRAELDAAAAIGWEAPEDGATIFSYRLTVERTDAGNPSWAACAEADLDGDGVVQALIAFQPSLDAQGRLVAPPAPCAHGPRLERPLTYQGETGPLRASPARVY